MRYKNTATGGRGFTVAGNYYEWDAGATLDVPDADVKAARLDPVNNGWFTDGTFVEVTAKAAPAPVAEPKAEAKPEPKHEPKSKGKPEGVEK